MTENEIGTILVGTAIEVHRELGPGLLETVYEVVLEHELKQRGLTVKRQVPISIVYKGIAFVEAFRADLLVADKVIVESFFFLSVSGPLREIALLEIAACVTNPRGGDWHSQCNLQSRWRRSLCRWPVCGKLSSGLEAEARQAHCHRQALWSQGLVA